MLGHKPAVPPISLRRVLEGWTALCADDLVLTDVCIWERGSDACLKPPLRQHPG
jgi:hypothetical protein